ncbi:MAG: hypothetical protein M1495_24870 [Bacteroidetes bacterium]|nr:hypothetical protein [Bacteroidota bacterium]
MKKHILLEKATRKPYSENISLPENAQYNHKEGYWLIDGLPLTKSKIYKDDIPGSKKCDLETGEDQKGQ